MKRFTFYFLLIALIGLEATCLIAQEFDGFAMYSSQNSSFLIDKNGDIAHRWNCNARNNYSAFIKDNGNLVRGAVNNGNALNGPAVGGKVQEYTPDGQLVWEFTYSSPSYVAHHDICAMPNGGVLLTAWEVPSLSELQGLGFQENSVKYPTHFVEVQQDGTGGKIVWEWHMKDHFIQDVDSTLANYGVVSENPQLMDINVAIPSQGGGPGGSRGDWFHVNGTDYDPEYDQIIFSSRYLSEIYIIDHSTTTEEAAGHTGGNSGMGGDLLWRWGNPANYKTDGPKLIRAAVHDSKIIPNDGRPNAGYAQIFNNEGLTGNSQIDEMELPRDGFLFVKQADQSYGPTSATWSHNCRDNADGQSAAAKLPNGNTFVNLSRGYMYEVDEDENLVWQYNDGPSKAFRYTCDHPGIQELIKQGYVDGALCESSANEDIRSNPFVIAPNPSNGVFYITEINEASEIANISITDSYGQFVKLVSDKFTRIDMSEYEPAVYFLSINFKNSKSVTKRIIVTQ